MNWLFYVMGLVFFGLSAQASQVNVTDQVISARCDSYGTSPYLVHFFRAARNPGDPKQTPLMMTVTDNSALFNKGVVSQWSITSVIYDTDKRQYDVAFEGARGKGVLAFVQGGGGYTIYPWRSQVKLSNCSIQGNW